jgi:autotransporter-associated beta strand protein
MTGGSITITGDGNPTPGSGPYPFGGGSPDSIVAAAGVLTNSEGQATLSNVAIRTTGSNSPAVDVDAQITTDELTLNPAGRPITITGGSITTSGASSFAVLVNANGGTAALNGTLITTSGAGAAGFVANAGTITATNTITQPSGTAAPGGWLSNGGILTINGGSVTTTGAGSFGFLFEPFLARPFFDHPPSSPEPNMLQISNATVNAAANAFHVAGVVADITVDRSTITSSNRVLLNTLSGGTISLMASGSQLTGAITTDSTSRADVTLQNSTWTMTGNSNLTNLVFNGGTLKYGDSFDISASQAITPDLASGGFAGGGTFDTNGFTATVSQDIQGAGRLTKAGAGTLILTGDNSFSGGTILDGTLVVGNLPGSQNEAKGISTALGTGNVLVGPGTLRTTSFQTGVPLTIHVGGNYTQKQTERWLSGSVEHSLGSSTA